MYSDLISINLKMGKQENQEVEAYSAKEDSTSSSSSTLTDLMEDASSNGPLYQLSELMNQLPIKRGLSKHYQGKSQSFKSLTSVNSLEELAKKEDPYNKRMKMCRTYGGGLKRVCSPKATIAKKASSRSSFLSSMVGRDHLLSACNRSYIIPLQK